MIFEVEVRHQQGAGDYFQPYTESVEALTSQDAKSRVQRANPGCLVRVTRSYNENNSESGSSFDFGDIGGTFGWIVLLGGLWALATLTPWVLMSLGGAVGTWVGQRITGQSIEEYAEQGEDGNHKKAAIILALAILAGGFGFVKGDEIKRGFDAPDTPAQVKDIGN